MILWTLPEGRRLGSEAQDAQHSEQPESLLSTLLHVSRLWGVMWGAPRAHRQLQWFVVALQEGSPKLRKPTCFGF